MCTGSSYTDSPGLNDTTDDDEEFYRETAGDERMALIEEEYIEVSMLNVMLV